MPSLVVGLAAVLLGVVLGAGVTLVLRRRPAPPLDAEQPPSPLLTTDDHQARLAEAGRHLAQVAHELRNPLGAILAFAEDLLQAEPTPEQREALLVIQQQARRSRLLVRGLLETLRATPPPHERIDASILVQRVARIFERECADKGITFDWNAGQSLPPLIGEEAGLEQVLTNLLQNAYQATPAGGRITLTARVRGRLLDFMVQDSGPGILPDVLPRIFEPFYTTKGPEEGTGLGLSVSQGIVRRHRGILIAENVPRLEGGGARFVVSLPFEDRRAKDRDASQEEIAMGPAAAVSSRRVLLIDDEEAVRIALRRFLTRKGWIVEEVGDGQSGLGRLVARDGEQFDAVICDLRLPDLSGMALYDRLAVATPGLEGRMVMVTGDAGAADVVEFQTRTGAVVLEKPYELAALEVALHRIVSAHGSTAGS